MAITQELLVNRLRDVGDKSVQFFLELNPDQFEIKIYTDGSQWSARQILAHFALAEDSLYRLVENIVNGGGGTPEDFNLNAYNEYKVSSVENSTVKELLDLFKRNRQSTIELVSGLGSSDLEKMGRHPFLGNAAVVDIIKLIYRHNQIHIREIRRAFG
jgi:hypothetical protein